MCVKRGGGWRSEWMILRLGAASCSTGSGWITKQTKLLSRVHLGLSLIF